MGHTLGRLKIDLEEEEANDEEQEAGTAAISSKTAVADVKVEHPKFLEDYEEKFVRVGMFHHLN